MRHATLRQLKVFETVARRLSFSRAAEELHLTQPAVSTQVRQLEQHVGMALFEQLGKKVYLTQAGQEMLRYSRTILQQLHDADVALEELRGAGRGRLNVSVISAGDYFFPRLLMAFKRGVPDFELHLSVRNRDGLLRDLAENTTDLAIMVRPPVDADTVEFAFAPHPYVIVAPADHPLVARRRIPLEELLSQAFVVREKGSDTWNSMVDGFGEAMTRVNVSMEIGSTETIKQAVIAGMGLSFLSAHTIGLELKAGLLAVLDVEGFPLMLNWHLVHRTTKRLPPVAQSFKDFLLAEGAQAIELLTGYTHRPRARATGLTRRR